MWARHEHVECGYGRVGEREAVGDPGQYRIHSYRSLSCHEHTEPGVLRRWTVITGGWDSAWIRTSLIFPARIDIIQPHSTVSAPSDTPHVLY